MNTCSRCRSTNIPATCQYCPMCGSPVMPAQNVAASLTGALGQLLVTGLVGTAERFVQSRVQQTVEPVAQLLEALTGAPAGPAVSAEPPPQWYEQAFSEGQPRMDPTEVARRQAAAQARSRAATQTLQMAMKSHHDSMMSIIGNFRG